MKTTTRLLIAAALTLTMTPGFAQGSCPDELFVQAAANPANGSYPAPWLTASCTTTTLTVQSNGIPGFAFQQITPNDLQAQSYTWQVDLAPELPATATSIPLLGTIGFTVSGLPIFGPNEAAIPAEEAYGDPVYNGIMDFCLGHTAQFGTYHFHALIVDCISQVTADDEPSPIIGYALDGFPIHGPRGCVDEGCTSVVEFESSWDLVGDPTSYAWNSYQYVEKDETRYLDECNGRIGPDGTYRYHATETFPYVLGCYGGLDVVKEPADTSDLQETSWVAVAASAGGAEGSLWSTDLSILNRTDLDGEIELILHTDEGDVSRPVSLPASGQVLIEDVVSTMAGTAVGSLEIRSNRTSLIQSRTMNTAISGATSGQSLIGLEARDGLGAGEVGWLPQLREDAGFRTNLGVLNMGPGLAEAQIQLVDGLGTLLADWTVEIVPGRVVIENRPLLTRAGHTDLDNAFATVRVLSGDGVWAYASVIDNLSNDPTTVALRR